MAKPYPIVGIEGTGVHPRLELHDLQKNDIQFSLFIRAFTKVENMNSAEERQKPNSWWQMGSIHGLPFTPWSGDPKGPQQEDSQSQWGGYCYHGSALFPTWHRVLVMLIEQSVVNEAIAISHELEAKDPAARAEKWVESAKALRFPFWDWTNLETSKEGVPKLCQETTLTIVNPGGSRSQVPNPLNHYQYAMNPGTAAEPTVKYMGNWKRTYRWANNGENPTTEMYDQAAKAFSQGTTLNLFGGPISLQPVTWLRQKIAGLFTYDLTAKDGYNPNMWAYFSNTGSADHNVEAPMPVMPSSLEEPHNMVHIDTGGNGSMSVNEYAGFDPIFFLHHTNVDRIYAFWEYVYPQYWIGNGWKDSKTGKTVPFITDNGTFWQDAGATIDHSTPLYPFRNKSLDYWTSDAVRGLLPTGPVNKHYTYPAITDPNTGVKVQVDVPYDVNNLALRQQFQQALHTEWGRDLNALADAHQNFPIPLPFSDLLLKQANGLLHLRQFAIIGHLPEFAFTGSYRLEIYMLPKIIKLVPAVLKQASGLLEQVSGLLDPVSGVLQQAASTVEDVVTHVVNNITVLGRADPEKCPACRERRAAGSLIRGCMHLDPHLILYIIASLDPTQLGAITGLDHISALIHGSFGMRLVRPDGTKLAAAEPDFNDEGPIEEAKLPKLELCSHVIKFDPADPTVPIQHGEYKTHGTFGTNHGWKKL